MTTVARKKTVAKKQDPDKALEEAMAGTVVDDDPAPVEDVPIISAAEAAKIAKKANKQVPEEAEEKLEDLTAEALISQVRAEADRIRKEEEEAADDGRLWVLKERQIDTFNRIRTRVELRPSTCDICGYDVCDTNDLPPYKDMPEALQARVEIALGKHKDMHPIGSAGNVIRTNQLSKRNTRRPN